MNKNYILLFFLLLASIIYAQDTAYWQQQVDYKINVSLDDSTHYLEGDIIVTYTNKSPDELNYIFFHLWPNAYKNRHTALARQQLENGKTDFHYAKEKDRGFIDKIDFRINNESINWYLDSSNIDIARLFLNKPLAPEEKITISTPFRVKIPKVFSRLGHAEQAYFITQWYPKPAVYDQKGWHPYPYLGQGEFYSEYGSFDVSITLPSNYVVAATGNLQNEEEKKWLNEKVKTTAKITDFNHDMTFPKSSKTTKTLRYKQDRVHDFAWFADKRYHVLKNEIELPHSKRKITGWLMFTNHKAQYWKDALPYLNNAVHYYSKWIGDYPYDVISVAEGAKAGGGMEYPTVTLIGDVMGAKALESVIVHEAGHNWWYGILGSNERAHPWIDEGLNSFYQNRYLENHAINKVFLDKKREFENIDITLASRELSKLFLDQPIETSSEKYPLNNYWAIVYGKTKLVFKQMMTYLGEDAFDKVMQSFYQKWKFKHIYPEDIKNHFDKEAPAYVGWVFDGLGLIRTTRQIDYEIKKIIDTVSIGKTTFYNVLVLNKGKIKAPFTISALKDDSIIETRWYDGHIPKYHGTKHYPKSLGLNDIIFPYGNYDALVINAKSNTWEVNRKNNTLKIKGPFKRIEKLKLSPFYSMDRPDRTEFVFAPIAGWNNNDKIMLGMAFYNGVLFPRRFEYTLAPMFTYNTKDIVGQFDIKHSIIRPRSSKLYGIFLSFHGKRFNYNTQPFNMRYNVIGGKADIIIRPENERSKIEQVITLSSRFIHQDIASSCATCGNLPIKNVLNSLIQDIRFRFSDNKVINPFSYNLGIQFSSFIKPSIEIKYRLNYSKNKGLNLRFFSGGILFNRSALDIRYRLGSWTGNKDYAYENPYFDRGVNDVIFSKQIFIRDGGFKVITEIGQTNVWLVAINLESHLPFTKHIKLFADIGTNELSGVSGTAPIMFDAGITLSIIPNIFEIYWAGIVSSDIKNDLIVRNNNELYKRFAFNINLAALNPIRLIKDKKLIIKKKNAHKRSY